MIGRARHFLRNGVRALWIFPSGELPGGRSPAHPDLDPLWAMLAEADCAATLHIAGEGNFFRTEGWRAAPAFQGFARHGEVNMDPWHLQTMHQPHENFLVAMVLGGVFERHPTLRFGLIELGAFWVGPLMRSLDLWHAVGSRAEQQAPEGAPETYRLPEPPSFYLRRNVRVTPYIFEDFSKDIEWYGVEDMLCFSTDYPHVEGGRNAFDTFNRRIARFGEAVAEKFFVTNGQLLLPL
jgi:predicted TIM-barrel fold metal-dependent hydrolase